MANYVRTVYIVEDHEVLRDGLARTLVRAGYAVQAFESAEHFFERAVFRDPAVLVLDMRLPLDSGLDVQRRLEALGNRTPVIFMSGQSGADEIISAFRAGAAEFLWKPFPADQLHEAVARAMAQSAAARAEREREHLLERSLAALSPRERQILPLLLEGHTNRQVAERVGIKPDTAKKHKESILEKLGLRDVPELIRFCSQAAPPAGVEAAPTAPPARWTR